MTDQYLESLPTSCSLCGRALGELPDDQPEWPGGPICGECYQARQLDDEISQDEGLC